MRHLGIDYGTKRIGVAVSDATGKMAFPCVVLPNDDQLLAALQEVIDTYEVEIIVIGHSLSKDMAPNTVQAGINELVTDLTLEFGLPVHLELEHYTTQAAIRIQGRNDQTDASAAALILDSFLQKQNE